MSAPRPLPRWFDLLFKHGYPPLWLRPVVPWWLLHFLDKRYPFCWSNVATWKALGSENHWATSEDCFGPHDYCGKFDCGEPRRQVQP